MKTNNNISYSRGRTSTSGFNQIKKVVKVLVILIGSIIGLVLWVFIRPIFRGVGWVISLISTLMIIFWLLENPGGGDHVTRVRLTPWPFLGLTIDN